MIRASAVVAFIVGVMTLVLVGVRPPVYQARVGLVATAAPEGVSAAQFGEVVSLTLPALAELARSPSVLAATAEKVAGAPRADELAGWISVELVPASGVARLSVRASSPELAGGLVSALVTTLRESDLLSPVGTLRPLDTRPDTVRLAPDWPLAIGFAIAAAVAAAVATATGWRLTRSRPETAAGEALASAGVRAAVLRDGDPGLLGRLAVLAAAAAREVRVVAVHPDLTERAESLAVELDKEGVGDTTAGVGIVAVSRRGEPRELTEAAGVLPATAKLIAVVLA
ncbi:hypothetical protein ACTG9Q_29030 [Actinokineospora sp. 24-640]